jgi:hypothetical protein
MVVICGVDKEARMATKERIRRIFLQPQASYGIAEAAELLEFSHEQIIQGIEVGDLAVDAHGELARLPWEEVALAAVERWPQHLIEAALGNDLQGTIPELVRLTELRVRVPQFNVVALGRVAQREGTTIDHLVARQLLELAVNEADTLDRSITGFSAAMRWPLQ